MYMVFYIVANLLTLVSKQWDLKFSLLSIQRHRILQTPQFSSGNLPLSPEVHLGHHWHCFMLTFTL